MPADYDPKVVHNTHAQTTIQDLKALRNTETSPARQKYKQRTHNKTLTLLKKSDTQAGETQIKYNVNIPVMYMDTGPLFQKLFNKQK